MDSKDQLEKSLLASVQSPRLKDLSGLLEVAVDSLLEIGVIRELPFVSTVSALYRGSVGIREKLFLKKVVKFLAELKDVPQADREKWVEQIDKKGAEGQRVGEALLLIIERLDDMDKPTLLGRLFKAYLNGLIDLADFRHVAAMIERAYMPDLEKLAQNFGFLDGETTHRLTAIGIMIETDFPFRASAAEFPLRSNPSPREIQERIAEAEQKAVKRAKPNFRVSRHGQMILEHCFSVK